MAKLMSLVVVFVILTSFLLSACDGRRPKDPRRLQTDLQWVPAMRIRDLTETACFPPNNTYGMYVAVPSAVFRNGEACNKTMRVSCGEPYRDLGGPWQACRNGKTHTVTVIDQVFDELLDDDLFRLSDKVFSWMARDTDSIRLIIHQ